MSQDAGILSRQRLAAITPVLLAYVSPPLSHNYPEASEKYLAHGFILLISPKSGPQLSITSD